VTFRAAPPDEKLHIHYQVAQNLAGLGPMPLFYLSRAFPSATEAAIKFEEKPHARFNACFVIVPIADCL
jgi:hypothetical protein